MKWKDQNNKYNHDNPSLREGEANVDTALPDWEHIEA